MTERIFSEQDLAQMSQMLPSNTRPLSNEAQVAIRGANCVLSMFQNESAIMTPGILISDVARCTGQQRSLVTWTLRLIEGAGLLEKQHPDGIIGLLYGSARPPAFYVPRMNAAGQQFFNPQRRPDCELTVQDGIVASLYPFHRELLHGLAQLAMADKPITRSGFRDRFARETLKDMLYRFVQAGVLVQYEDNKDQYQLTERGLWLTNGLKSAPKADASPKLYRLPFSAPTPEPVVKPQTREPKITLKPPAAAGEKTEKPTVVEQWLIEIVNNKHLTESHTLTRALSQLIRDGVLRFSEVRQPTIGSGIWVYNPGKDRRFGFSDYAMKHTTPEQRKAIVVWAKIDILFYGKHLIPKNVEMELNLGKDSYLETYVPRSIYRPLVETIAAEKAAKKQEED